MAGSKTNGGFRKFPPALRRDLELRRQALGSEGEHYLELVTGLVETLAPEDLIEHLLVRQAVDHAWHISRLRQIETSLLSPAQPLPQPGAAADTFSHGRFDEVSAALFRESLIAKRGFRDNAEYLKLKKQFEPEMRQEEQRLREESRQRALQASPQAVQASPQAVSHGSTPESLAAAYVTNSAHLEKVSRGIVLAESRFAASLKELDRYRAARRPQSKGETSPILDAEFMEVAAEEPRDITPQAGSQPPQRAAQHRPSHRQRQSEGGTEQPKARAQRSHPAERRARKGGA